MKGDADITYPHQAVVGYSRVELNICITYACLPSPKVPLTRAWSTIRKPSRKDIIPHQAPRESDIRLNQVRLSENTDESRVSQDKETGESEYDGRNTFPCSVLTQAKGADLIGLEALGRLVVSAISGKKIVDLGERTKAIQGP